MIDVTGLSLEQLNSQLVWQHINTIILQQLQLAIQNRIEIRSMSNAGFQVAILFKELIWGPRRIDICLLKKQMKYLMSYADRPF